jgi:hypothetical protein
MDIIDEIRSRDTVEQAIANIAATSEALERMSNNPNRKCSPYAANLLEQMAWELHKQADELREINYLYVS